MASIVAWPGSSGGFIKSQTHLAEDVLLPGIRDRLEDFYKHGSPQDKARCLELLTSLDIGQVITDPGSFRLTSPVRPKSAMGSIVQQKVPRSQKLNLLQTTYKREYSAPSGLPASATRPGSTIDFQPSHDLSGPIGKSTYRSDYASKSSVPNRVSVEMKPRNNPHPLNTFMNWRLPPMKSSKDFYKSSIPGLDEEMFDRVCRGQVASTYQSDYLGIPQGFKGIKRALAVPEDWRAEIPYTLDTYHRLIYQRPEQERILKGNNTRWGCNEAKQVPADSAVPCIPKNSVQKYVRTRTTYDREYTEPYYAPQEVKDTVRMKGAMKDKTKSSGQ